ncbi:MAG: hypothetical protein HYY67_00140 [Thaumarchaeota archaeon]|nr:hypothetical protein [Nitrososphaerota archaeon]
MEIGTYSIPEPYRLPSLVNDIRTIYNKFESKEVDLDTLAPILGHKSAKSGAFTSKLASMRAYNLIDGRGKVRVTETGRKIALPSPNKPDEQNEGLIEAVNNIPLWRELYQKLTKVGKPLSPTDFWVEIRQICSVAPEEAQNKAELVRKAYLEDIKDISVPKQGEKQTMSGTQNGGQGAGSVTPQATINTEVISFEGGALRVTLPKENIKDSWKRVKKMVDAYFGTDKDKD